MIWKSSIINKRLTVSVTEIFFLLTWCPLGTSTFVIASNLLDFNECVVFAVAL
jgi:hypothetical protein